MDTYNTNKLTRKFFLTFTAGVLATSGARAYELKLGTNMPPVDFHGFVSQGLLLSTANNYLGESTKSGDPKFFEAGVNASFNPFPRTHITAQGFMFDVGNVGEYKPFLDYAQADYTFNDELGVRSGRIRRPQGIYNAIQDIDLARTFVLLPQGMYDARWRDWSAGLDGGELFGNIGLGKGAKAGSISYEAYAGLVNMTGNGGVARYIENGLPPSPIGSFQDIDSTPVFGGQLWYNTPVDGLRFGASLAFMEGFGYNITVNPPYGPGSLHNVGNVTLQQYSAEYLWKNWTFQAEYYTYIVNANEHARAYGNAVIGSVSDNPATWYVAASYRFNKYFETGAYYTEFRDYSTPSSNPDGHQNDAAVSFRFDPKDWWTFKIEGHYIQGTGLLRDDNNNPIRNSGGWFMLAVKTTVSF